MEDDLKIIEDLLKEYECLDYRFGNMLGCKETNAIEKLLQAYKQDEKVINEMAIAMENEHCSIENIVNEEICDQKRCVGTAMQCRDCIINYFRKKCG